MLAAAAVHAQVPAEPVRLEEPAAAPRFDVLEYEIHGNSVLSVAAIEQAVTPHLGPGLTMDDVEAARAALEKVYQGAGYLTVFVDVPEQQIVDGIVRLSVLEGRIERLQVSGARYFSQGHIRGKTAELAEGQVPNFNQVQRQLALVNRSEERQVQPVLKPGKFPGTVDVELKVRDELPLSATVELHNQHAPDTDPWRLQASLRYDNLWQRDHGIALTAITAPREPDQARVLVANYTVPLDNGHTLVGYLVDSNSSVATLGGVNVLGKGTTLGLRYAMPFFGSGGSYHSVTLGADLKDLEERVSFGDATIDTPLRYVPFQLAYTGQSSERGSNTQWSTTLVFATRQLLSREVACPGSTEPVDQFACKRQGADGSFSTLRAELRHGETRDWGGASLRLGAQFATQPLGASAEQYSLGGADTVRGYLEGEATGDEGLLASFELRSPNFGPRVSRWLDESGPAAMRELSAHAFVDAARTRTLLPALGQQARTPLLGTGLGLRLATRHGLSGTLDVAWPRKTTRATTAGDARVHVRVGLKF